MIEMEAKFNPLDGAPEFTSSFDHYNPSHQAIFSDYCSCHDIEESSLLYLHFSQKTAGLSVPLYSAF